MAFDGLAATVDGLRGFIGDNAASLQGLASSFTAGIDSAVSGMVANATKQPPPVIKPAAPTPVQVMQPPAPIVRPVETIKREDLGMVVQAQAEGTRQLIQQQAEQRSLLATVATNLAGMASGTGNQQSSPQPNSLGSSLSGLVARMTEGDSMLMSRIAESQRATDMTARTVNEGRSDIRRVAESQSVLAKQVDRSQSDQLPLLRAIKTAIEKTNEVISRNTEAIGRVELAIAAIDTGGRGVVAFTFAVEELRTGRSIKFTGQSDSLSINWSREFRVKVSADGGDKAKDVDPFAVITAPGLPIVNRSIYTAGNKLIPFVICREKTVKQNPAKLDQWDVQTAYRSIDKNRAESNNQPIDPPDDITDIAPTEQPSLGEIERVLYKDKASTPKKILLPSGAHFSEPVMERIPTLQVRLTQYEASITYEQMLERKFKVNSGTYRSKDRYQWLITEVEATEVDVLLSGGETSAALVTYTLSHLPLDEGWKKALALIDYKHLVSGKFVPHLSGDPRTASQTFVDATGAKKADQSVPDYVEFEPQGELDFSTFLQA